MVKEQSVPFVSVLTTVTLTGPPGSLAEGSSKLHAELHSTVLLLAQVRLGGSVSMTVTTWVQVLLLPQASVTTQTRVAVRVLPQPALVIVLSGWTVSCPLELQLSLTSG